MSTASKVKLTEVDRPAELIARRKAWLRDRRCLGQKVDVKLRCNRGAATKARHKAEVTQCEWQWECSGSPSTSKSRRRPRLR
jgi:hypothetical protein